MTSEEMELEYHEGESVPENIMKSKVVGFMLDGGINIFKTSGVTHAIVYQNGKLIAIKNPQEVLMEDLIRT